MPHSVIWTDSRPVGRPLDPQGSPLLQFIQGISFLRGTCQHFTQCVPRIAATGFGGISDLAAGDPAEQHNPVVGPETVRSNFT